MDPKANKAHTKRPPQDPEQLSSRRQTRLFLSETVPPTAHQIQANVNRGHNLSDRIHDYYEKLVNSCETKQKRTSYQSHLFPGSHFHQAYGEQFLGGRNPVTVPRYSEEARQSISGRAALQPSNINARHSYAVYVEDPTGAFQRFEKKTHPVVPLGTSYFDEATAEKDLGIMEKPNTRNVRESSKSPSLISKASCTLCHSSNHSSQVCPLKSCMPAEHDGFFSGPNRSGNSPPTRHSKGSDENQGDGSEDKSGPSFPKKRAVPANINVHCERDVIGQEKSPVSKSHPIGSGALSTSSSNGDSVPRERKKWVRPPLVGQAASGAENSPFMSSAVFDCPDDQSSPMGKRKASKECLQMSSSTGSDQADSRESSKGFSQIKSSYFDSSSKAASCLPHHNDEFYSEIDQDGAAAVSCPPPTSEGEQGLSDSCAGGRVSPSSSITSNRRLEWDSGADVGYNQVYNSANPDLPSSGLCTIERMALAQGCSVALHLRLDPEGTTVPTSTSGLAARVLPSPPQDKTIPSLAGKPIAESTPLDQVPQINKALRRYRNDSKNFISPILQSRNETGAEVATTSTQICEDERDIEPVGVGSQAQMSNPLESPSSSKSFHRQMSNSMQDLRKCSNQSGNLLLKSQSDPDLSGEAPTLVARVSSSKSLKGTNNGRNSGDAHAGGHSISSGSDATLVHVGTEEDLAVDKDPCMENSCKFQNQKVQESVCSQSSEPERGPDSTKSASEPKTSGSEKSSKSSSLQTELLKHDTVLMQPKQTKHCCSDSDHKRGLHHHFGVLCSSALGGSAQSFHQPNIGSQLQNVVHGPDRVYGLAPSSGHNKQGSREMAQSPSLQDSENFAGESTGSSAFHSDAAHEDNAPCASTLTGRVNSFEYLPGHMFEKNPHSGLQKHERPPGISTSTETDSEPARPLSRAMHRTMVDSSSHDTEDDRLWGSPRVGSNTLVQDLERGVSLLKGVMENKSAGRRSKRELIRRIIKKLVTSEYVEDVIEKEKARHRVRSPFSPRKTKYQDRNTRLKRPQGTERQEISGESDEPKQRAPNARRKIPVYQTSHHISGSRTHTTLASGSKSSSLWSSQAESTSGSISLSGSSNNHKESRNSVKSNPTFNPPAGKATDWLKPATQSEKLFEMRKHGTSPADKNLAGLLGMHIQESAIDPIAFKNDPQKQLSWVKNEINQLKILKQLLQKQESLKQSLTPNLCRTTITTMPVTGMKQSMQMADCTSPDVPESHSPKQSKGRLQQWISLESDTSAGFGLSNHTESSQDSNWLGVEVASGGDQDHHPRRTVSISDADQATEASGSLSNRKSDVSQSSGPQIVQKTRRRSVSISDTDHQLGPPATSDAPVVKKRSDCHCQKAEGRVFTTKPVHGGSYGPPRNFASEKQGCQNCAPHSHMVVKGSSLPAGASRNSIASRGFSSLGQPRMGTTGQRFVDQRAQGCSCGASKAQAMKCCCSAKDGLSANVGGAVKKGVPVPPQKTVSRSAADIPSMPGQFFSGGGMIKVRIETDEDSAHEQSESVRGSTVGDTERVTDVSTQGRGPIVRTPSDDSITTAVTQAVSSKVKALKNLGQIEEAEVKIRVKVAPGQVSSDGASQSEKGRVLKTQDLEDESNFYPSKRSELDDMIARQRAMDMETRQKLLSIAETRQRAQLGMHDIDRRIQDLLLEDFLSRQLKGPESTSTPHARLNVRVEAPVMPANSVGVQSEVDKKTIGTSTSIAADRTQTQPQPTDVQVQPRSPPTAAPRGGCVCGPGAELPTPRSLQPQSLVNQGQQTESLPGLAHGLAQTARPQTAPTPCTCSCRSQAASAATTPRTYRASPRPFSPERQIEFELELRKPRPYQMTPFEVHQTLKSRNTAYFLQFEEDNSLPAEPLQEISKPPMEVVTMKIPKQKRPGVATQTGGPQPSKGGLGHGAGLGPSGGRASPSGEVGSPGHGSSGQEPAGASQFDIEFKLGDQGVTSTQQTREIPIDGTNVLRITPGRSHLSISITDSSAESLSSADGDSKNSSHQRPSRKEKKGQQSNKKIATFQIGESGQTIDAGQGITSKAVSASNLNAFGHSNKHSVKSGESLYDYVGDDTNSFPTLQEYLEKNHPKYLDAAEKRRRCIAEMSYLRRLRQQSRKRLLELEGDSMWAKQKQQWRSRCASRPRPVLRRKPSPKKTKSAYTRRLIFLPESQQRLAELRKKEEKRTNRLMAEIYTRKLQEKVLKGCATVRSSISVISSL